MVFCFLWQGVGAGKAQQCDVISLHVVPLIFCQSATESRDLFPQ